MTPKASLRELSDCQSLQWTDQGLSLMVRNVFDDSGRSSGGEEHDAHPHCSSDVVATLFGDSMGTWQLGTAKKVFHKDDDVERSSRVEIVLARRRRLQIWCDSSRSQFVTLRRIWFSSHAMFYDYRKENGKIAHKRGVILV